ncbi:hypothetical protein B0F90DRAFT_1668110 [Multifurca ochricompacta]|uniref:Uncharacterized protein n=1 Tax=Multifurca ochricompacta TaxID=376703 RepID=A0AAD4M4E2_9AGAM|nr:hypothetical protein B0F90DRAFT_1668110 [Multifurca ochricompacta]
MSTTCTSRYTEMEMALVTAASRPTQNLFRFGICGILHSASRAASFWKGYAFICAGGADVDLKEPWIYSTTREVEYDAEASKSNVLEKMDLDRTLIGSISDLSIAYCATKGSAIRTEGRCIVANVTTVPTTQKGQQNKDEKISYNGGRDVRSEMDVRMELNPQSRHSHSQFSDNNLGLLLPINDCRVPVGVACMQINAWRLLFPPFPLPSPP